MAVIRLGPAWLETADSLRHSTTISVLGAQNLGVREIQPSVRRVGAQKLNRRLSGTQEVRERRRRKLVDKHIFSPIQHSQAPAMATCSGCNDEGGSHVISRLLSDAYPAAPHDYTFTTTHGIR
jgi:hypothetical protein